MPTFGRVWTLVNQHAHGRAHPGLLVLGDSNALISYYPPWSRKRWTVAVGRDLGVRVSNWATNGGTARALIDSGKLAAALRSHAAPRCVIAFGINDGKARTPDEFEADLAEIIDAARAAGVERVWLLTTVWLDYPDHYGRDRDAELAPYNEAIRHVAAAAGAELVDVNEGLRQACAEHPDGWDTRLRSTNPALPYSNVHYNARGTAAVARMVTAALRATADLS